jgi:hypothetical protein
MIFTRLKGFAGLRGGLIQALLGNRECYERCQQFAYAFAGLAKRGILKIRVLATGLFRE